jgi:hypothetical protein
MKKTLLLLLSILTLQGFAQMDKTQKVVLFTGENFTGSHLSYEVPILKPATFKLDDKTFDTQQIAFFQNNNGYFGNLCRIHGAKAERYALRIKAGKVDLYEEIEMSVYSGDELNIDPTNAREKEEMLASGKTFQYYHMPNRELKKANVYNMKVDLADNANSLKEVRNIRKYQVLQGLLIGVGAGIIAGDILKQSGGSVHFDVPMAIGVVVAGTSYFCENAKDNAKWLAVDYYNR